MTRHELKSWLALVLPLMIAAAMLAGCQGKSSASFNGTETTTTLPDGTVIKSQKTQAESQAIAAPASSQPSPSSATIDEAMATVAGVWQQMPTDPRMGPMAWVWSCGGLLLIAVGAWQLSTFKWMFGGCLVGAGLLCAVVPFIAVKLSWLIIIAIGLLFIGVLWFVAQWAYKNWVKQKGITDSAKVMNEGLKAGDIGTVREAVAIKRATDPKFDEAFVDQKATKVVVVGTPSPTVGI